MITDPFTAGVLLGSVIGAAMATALIFALLRDRIR